MIKSKINKLQTQLKLKNIKYNGSSLLGISLLIMMFIFGIFKPPLKDFLDLGFSGILVLISYIYTSFTKDILEDGKKKREIEFTLKQLECFYNPIKEILYEFDYELQNKKSQIQYEEVIQKSSKIIQFQHLAKEKTEIRLRQFIDSLKVAGVMSTNTTDTTNKLMLLTKQVEIDITEIRKYLKLQIK